MKNLIYLSIICFATIIPDIALSKPKSKDITSAEKKIIISFICSNEDYSREEVISTINSSDISLSNAKKNGLADMIMDSQQMPEENKAAICES